MDARWGGWSSTRKNHGRYARGTREEEKVMHAKEPASLQLPDDRRMEWFVFIVHQLRVQDEAHWETFPTFGLGEPFWTYFRPGQHLASAFLLPREPGQDWREKTLRYIERFEIGGQRYLQTNLPQRCCSVPRGPHDLGKHLGESLCWGPPGQMPLWCYSRDGPYWWITGQVLSQERAARQIQGFPTWWRATTHVGKLFVGQCISRGATGNGCALQLAIQPAQQETAFGFDEQTWWTCWRPTKNTREPTGIPKGEQGHSPPTGLSWSQGRG